MTDLRRALEKLIESYRSLCEADDNWCASETCRRCGGRAKVLAHAQAALAGEARVEGASCGGEAQTVCERFGCQLEQVSQQRDLAIGEWHKLRDATPPPAREGVGESQLLEAARNWCFFRQLHVDSRTNESYEKLIDAESKLCLAVSNAPPRGRVVVDMKAVPVTALEKRKFYTALCDELSEQGLLIKDTVRVICYAEER